MPEETHRHLIEFDSRGANAVIADIQRLEQQLKSLQSKHMDIGLGLETRLQGMPPVQRPEFRKEQESQEILLLREMDVVNQRLRERRTELERVLSVQQRITDATKQSTQAQDRVTEATQRTTMGGKQVGAPVSPEQAAAMPLSIRQQIEAATGGVLPEPVTTRPPEETLTARERLGKKLEEIEADAKFATAAFEKFDALVKAHIPAEVALGRVVGKTASEFEKLAEAVRKPLTQIEKLQGRMEQIGAGPRFRAQTETRFRELERAGIPEELARPQAERETLRAFREAEVTARRQAIPPSERVRAEAQARGFDPTAETAAVERLNELRAARIPIERAIKQSVNDVERALIKEEAAARKVADVRRETMATRRTQQETFSQAGLRPIREEEFEFVEKMEKMGIPARNMVKVLDEMNVVMDSSIGSQAAFSKALRNVKQSLDETGGSAQKSGHWLGRYIQRYLVRYLIVWQGMKAVQSTIRGWVVAHDEFDRSLFRVQTTMGLSTSQAERYMATMRQMGGRVGLPAAQMAGGAMQLGATAGMAGQFGAMSGMGGAEGMKFFAGIQKQYGMGAEELEELIPRIWAAFAESGEDIQTFLGHWQEMVNALGGGSDAVNKWTRDLGTHETTSMRATDNVKAAWTDMLTVIGDTQWMTDTKNAWADFFSVATGQVLYTDLTRAEQRAAQARYEAETGEKAARMGQFFPTGGFWDWFAEKGMEGAVPSIGGGGVGGITTGAVRDGEGATGTQFIDSVKIMTQAQYDQLDAATEHYEGILEAKGIISSDLKIQTAIQTEHGYKFDDIATTMLAMLFAEEEIRDMQRQQMTGYFNWPGAQPSVMIGRSNQVKMSGGDQGPNPPPYTSATGGELYVPGAGLYDNDPNEYQEGGIVRETGAALVHRGEYVFSQEQVNRLGLPMLERLVRNQPMDMPTDRLQGSVMGLMANVPRYQHGGIVPGQGPQPAIVHGGEQIVPRGQTAMGSLKVHSDLYLDGSRIAQSVTKIAGDKLLQAQRAAMGATGSLISI